MRGVTPITRLEKSLRGHQAQSKQRIFFFFKSVNEITWFKNRKKYKGFTGPLSLEVTDIRLCVYSYAETSKSLENSLLRPLLEHITNASQ